MEKVNENDVKSNENNKNININTYGDKKVKLYKYCEKCGAILPVPSGFPFCDFYCFEEFRLEQRQDMDDVIGELWNRD